MIAVIRGILVIAGLLAALWSGSNFLWFLHGSTNDRLATRVLSGEVFKDVELVQTVEANRTSYRCDVPALHTLAILELRNLEVAIAAHAANQISSAQTNAHNAIVASLSCAPADAFLWLVLAWVDRKSDPGVAEALAFLRLSYQIGPNEGWIATKRNFIALSMFDQLPVDIADRALVEFSQLVRAGRYEETANILLGPGWAQRQLLLGKLSKIEGSRRDGFLKVLTNRGIDMSAVGLEPFPERPHR